MRTVHDQLIFLQIWQGVLKKYLQSYFFWTLIIKLLFFLSSSEWYRSSWKIRGIDLFKGDPSPQWDWNGWSLQSTNTELTFRYQYHAATLIKYTSTWKMSITAKNLIWSGHYTPQALAPVNHRKVSLSLVFDLTTQVLWGHLCWHLNSESGSCQSS